MGPKLRNQLEEGKEDEIKTPEKLNVEMKILENLSNQLTKSRDVEENMVNTERYYKKLKERLQKVSEFITTLSDQMIEDGADVEKVLSWSNNKEEELDQFGKLMTDVETWLTSGASTDINMSKHKQKQQDQLFQEQLKQQQQSFQWIMEQQKRFEEMHVSIQEREEKWYQLKMEREEKMAKAEKTKETTQSVKLQRYTITKFNGDYKDWLRFWNQFTVEVDGSSLPEISKFNYLLELVEGKPKEDILGLPHTVEGYEEAKRILQETYGKDIKVHKALIMELETLPEITNIRRTKDVHEFYNRLARVIRTLKTMGKIATAQAHVYTIFNKLGPVKEILAQNDDKWEDWGLEEVTEQLRKYVDRNPIQAKESVDHSSSQKGHTIPNSMKREDRLLMTSSNRYQQQQRSSNRQNSYAIECVYCGLNNHKSADCMKVLSVAKRRDILVRKNLCFNCTKHGHAAANCPSRGCFKCKGRHHTSICLIEPKSTIGKTSDHKENEKLGALSEEVRTLHPTVTAMVNGERVRIMLDSGAGSSYVCTELLTKLNLKPIRREKKTIEQLYGTIKKNVEIYHIKLSSLMFEDFAIDIKCTNAEKDILTYLPTADIKQAKRRDGRLRRLQFTDDGDGNGIQPVHIIMGAADYQRIKTTEPPILGKNPDQDPGAELTMLGWTLTGRMVSSHTESEKEFFVNSGPEEFERMCSLDVLGITDCADKSKLFHEEFKEKLKKEEDGYYTTRLPWKNDIKKLPSNKELAFARLKSTTRKLEKMEKLEEYDKIMQEQISDGILEEVPQQQTGEIIHYIPHQAVIRKGAESTKMRIVYDCSARKDAESPSLNDCLEVGPPLQPLIFDILLRNRMNKYCILADIQKAFLQIRLDEKDRDAQRLVWYNNLQERKIVELRFTRVIFGAGPSPYILGSTLETHIDLFKDIYPETVKALRDDTYVDDVQYGSNVKENLQKFKDESTLILEKGGFKLHKWHSNIKSLEETKPSLIQDDEDSTYAKQSTGTATNDTKILGLPWNKETDEVCIDFTTCIDRSKQKQMTKRKMISAINSVFDVLGLSSPLMINAKLLYSQACRSKLRWDEKVPEDINKKWNKWIENLEKIKAVTVPRSAVNGGEDTNLVIHGFSDASKVAVCAAVYLVETWDNNATSRLLLAKSRIAPLELSIPRKELVAAHLLSKLMKHVKETLLQKHKISEWHGWVDSTTVLYWLKDKGTWSTFVRNRTKAIKETDFITWHYVPTKDNPSDLGSRGVQSNKISANWFKGPDWIASKKDWPTQPEVTENEEITAERITKKEHLGLATTEQQKDNRMNILLNKLSYWKLLRVTSFIKRFIHNCKNADSKISGPLTTDEISNSEVFWLKLVQNSTQLTTNMELRHDDNFLLRCYGRVQGYHPIFIPREHELVALIINYHHKKTLHGGVSSTMSSIREKFWIPKLRALVKKAVYRCNLCKRYRIKPLSSPKIANLPNYRTEQIEPFAVTGVDFAGPMLYKINKKRFSKCYVSLFTCASTRAVHLRLCPDLTGKEFQRALKEFVARRGPPQIMVSDNGKTFVATGKWLKTLRQDEQLNNFLATQSIKWKFNLSRAPWWGGMFERLIGIMKKSLSKVVGKGLLTYSELEEVLLDVECSMNNRPLCYQEEGIDLEVLTPNILLRGKPAVLLEEDVENIDENSAVKRIKFVKRCKEQVNKRWTNEYIHALEERMKKQVQVTETLPAIGSIVLLKDDVKNKAQWRTGRIQEFIKGKDGVIRGLKLKLGNGNTIERPIQMVCDMEIGAVETKDAINGVDGNNNDNKQKEKCKDDKDTIERPTRKAKLIAKRKIKTIYDDNDE